VRNRTEHRVAQRLGLCPQEGLLRFFREEGPLDGHCSLICKTLKCMYLFLIEKGLGRIGKNTDHPYGL
jgi:hypothetical protein